MNGRACQKTENLSKFGLNLVYRNSSEENTLPKSKNKFFSVDLTTFLGIIKGRNRLGALI
jgi:GTP-sensing pleiotropic transcriptional regulator CodY